MHLTAIAMSELAVGGPPSSEGLLRVYQLPALICR
jgi:hypothetical protein